MKVSLVVLSAMLGANALKIEQTAGCGTACDANTSYEGESLVQTTRGGFKTADGTTYQGSGSGDYHGSAPFISGNYGSGSGSGPYYGSGSGSGDYYGSAPYYGSGSGSGDYYGSGPYYGSGSGSGDYYGSGSGPYYGSAPYYGSGSGDGGSIDIHGSCNENSCDISGHAY